MMNYACAQSCYVPEDQYMFGPEIMVAPVLELGARSRCVYLPSGVRWREGDTGFVREGGVWIDVAAPLDMIHHFYRL
jgi:alpha-D-xyloside xylohydrolase